MTTRRAYSQRELTSIVRRSDAVRTERESTKGRETAETK